MNAIFTVCSPRKLVDLIHNTVNLDYNDGLEFINVDNNHVVNNANREFLKWVEQKYPTEKNDCIIQVKEFVNILFDSMGDPNFTFIAAPLELGYEYGRYFEFEIVVEQPFNARLIELFDEFVKDPVWESSDNCYYTVTYS